MNALEKRIARSAVFIAIQSGRMAPARERRCKHCGAQAQEYHHSDYAKPLNVVPLCRACHRHLHKILRDGPRSEIIRIAMTPKEIADADALAYSYGMTLPEFVRVVLVHIEAERPAIMARVTPRRPGRPPKRHAPAAQNGRVTA